MQHFSEHSSSSVQRGVIDAAQETNDRIRGSDTSQRDYRKSKEDGCQRQPSRGCKLSNEWYFVTCKRTNARETSVQTWEPWKRSTCVSKCNQLRKSTRTSATGEDVDFQVFREKKWFFDAGACCELCTNQGMNRRSCGNGTLYAGEIHVNAYPNSSIGDPAAGAPNDGYNRLSELKYRSGNEVRDRGKIPEDKSPITRKNIGCGICEAIQDRLFADVALQVVVCSKRDANTVTVEPAEGAKTASKKSSDKGVSGQMGAKRTETSKAKKTVVVKKRSNIGSSKRRPSVKSSGTKKKKVRKVLQGKKLTDGKSSTNSTKVSGNEGGVKNDLHVTTPPVPGLRRICVDVMTDDDLSKHDRILCAHVRPVASLTNVPPESEDKNSLESEGGESVIANDFNDETSASPGGGQKNDETIDKVETESKVEILQNNIEADGLNKLGTCSSKCKGITTQLQTCDKLRIKSGAGSSKKQTEYESTSLEENQEALKRDSAKKKSVGKKPRKARRSSRSSSSEQDDDFPQRKLIQSKHLDANEIQKVKTKRNVRKCGQERAGELQGEQLVTVTDETVTTCEKSTTAGKSRTRSPVTVDEPSLASFPFEKDTLPKSGKLGSRRREASSVMTIWQWLCRKHQRSRTPAEIPMFGKTSPSSGSHDNHAAKDPFLSLLLPDIASDFAMTTAGDSTYGTGSFDGKAACASLSKVDGGRGSRKVRKSKNKH
ncbi:uncharacterized protein [Neodiprion pinetum]|uniref:uncharacterized protein n=1 Tax=Neodiprion pinetum TaxID=441929 RepID=UPI0037101947